MKTGFKIATLESVSDVLEMMKEFNTIDNYQFNKKITEKNLRDFLCNPELGRLWLIQIDGMIIGYIVLTFGFSFEYQGKDAFIDEFFIREDFRKKGIGKRTLEFVLSKAEKLGVKALHLEVEKHNNANRLYKGMGFDSIGRELLTKRLVN